MATQDRSTFRMRALLVCWSDMADDVREVTLPCLICLGVWVPLTGWEVLPHPRATDQVLLTREAVWAGVSRCAAVQTERWDETLTGRDGRGDCQPGLLGIKPVGCLRGGKSQMVSMVVV